MTGMKFTFPVRIYYEDTDHGGVVYHANYLKFMERARTEFLRTLGLELDALDAEHGILFALSEAQVCFRRPALFNDLLVVETGLTRLAGARMEFVQRIWRQQPRSLLVEADIRLACIERSGRVRRIPRPVATALRSHLLPEEQA